MTQVCAIVGAGAGLGQALAARFGREGYQVALLARSATTLTRLKQSLAADGVTAETFAADASDYVQLSAALQQVADQLGAPDVLIYNAVGFTPGPLADATPAKLNADLTVSAVSALAAAQAVLPAMRAAGRGTLLFTGGGAALNVFPGVAGLSINKAATRMLALGLAQELAGSGVRVGTITIFGTIAPGTPFAPERIAEAYWDFHSGSEATAEVNFRG